MENNLINTISLLIDKKREGGYWDFKKCWYTNNADLLHDIICMANNIENKDAYIIIGVTNSGEMIDVSNDHNRKNTANIVDIIRTKKFVGQYRPIVRVETLLFRNINIDVIIVKNTTNTPYVLEEDFSDSKNITNSDSKANSKMKHEVVRQGNVYTRIQDTNTPKDKTADYDKVELLWRKRFFLDASPIDKLNLFLKDTIGWELNSNQDEWYYKFSNELFKIKNVWEENSVKTNTIWDYISIYRPWSKNKIEIIWQNVIIKTYEVLNNCKYSAIMPDCKLIYLKNDDKSYLYWYYLINSEKELIQRLFEKDYKFCRDKLSPIQFDFYDENIIIFENEFEKNEFENYLVNSWDSLKTDFNNQQDNQEIDSNIFQQDFKCIKFFPKIFKQWKYCFK